MFRKLAITGVVASMGVIGFLATPAAHANPTCNNADGSPTATHDANFQDYTVQVCPKGTGVFDGTITVQYNTISSNGYIIADGNSSNTRCLGGYYGYSANDQERGLVGSSSGDYNTYKPGWNDPQSPNYNPQKNKTLVNPQSPSAPSC